MAIEHKAELIPASWSPKGWQDRLNELAEQGWQFRQAIERVDGWLIILLRQVPDKPPLSVRRPPPPAAPPSPGQSA